MDCNQNGLERIVLKQGKMIGYFIADQQSNFYQSSSFRNVLSWVQQNHSIAKIKEKQTRSGLRLLLTFDNITSVSKGLTLINTFLPTERSL